MSELEITRVVLYKTGLGFFEKKGKIDLSTQKKIKISFKNTNMNDLLKTFSIMRVKGDLIVAGVSYEGENTNTAKLLEDCLINLPESSTLRHLLSQMRGFDVKLQSSSDNFEGTIVGLQNRQEAVSDKSLGIIEETYIMLKNLKGQLITVKLKDIVTIEIIDPTIKNDFNFFMDIVQSMKSDKYRNVTIYFQGSKTSEFLLTFLQEMPAFKVSWRIYLLEPENDYVNSDDKEVLPEIPLLLHGWAIIDNVLDEDWQNVRLSLISGLPISFKYDSYSPQYISRPIVDRQQDLSIEKAPPLSQPPTTQSYETFEKKTKTEDPLEIVNKIITSSNIKGSGYEYKIPMKVTVKRNQSSLIPIVQSNLNAKMVSVYNESIDKKRPMTTLEFKNETGMVLEEGPISIFKDDVFQGEAVLPFLEKGEQQRIPYSINQAIEVSPEIKTFNRNFHEIDLQYYAVTKYYTEIHKVYKIRNVSEKPHVLIVEHPKNEKYDLFDSIKPDEESQNFYRFKIFLKKSESKSLVVKERKIISQNNVYTNLSRGIVEKWIELKLIDEPQYSKLITGIEFSEEIQRILIRISTLETQRSTISQEQERIRGNLDVLGKTDVEKNLKDRYIKKFEMREKELDLNEKELEKLRNDERNLREKWQKYIQNTFQN